MLGDRRHLEVYFAEFVILNLKWKKKKKVKMKTKQPRLKVLGFYALLGLLVFII